MLLYMQVDYILNVEDQLRRVGFKAKKPTSKAYYDYSACEMVINRLIVLLWGGESFDSRQSNQMLLKHQQNFYNSHRVRFTSFYIIICHILDTRF